MIVDCKFVENDVKPANPHTISIPIEHSINMEKAGYWEKKYRKKSANTEKKKKQTKKLGQYRKSWSLLVLAEIFRIGRACHYHYENTPIQLYWKFYHQKMKNFR